jgi:hypothetical protein
MQWWLLDMRNNCLKDVLLSYNILLITMERDMFRLILIMVRFYLIKNKHVTDS